MFFSVLEYQVVENNLEPAILKKIQYSLIQVEKNNLSCAASGNKRLKLD